MTSEIPPAQQGARLDALEAAVRARSDLAPSVGIVLGSGLGVLADGVADAVAIPFTDLPGWPAPTAPGHAGRLVLGRLEGVPVALLQGRFHLYEGHPASLVAEPVLLLGRLGAGVIVFTNISGGLRPGWRPGTIMAIADHLNLTGQNPLVGANDEAIGPRFPDMGSAWDHDLRSLLRRAGELEGTAVLEGVYAGLLGPSYETPAEVRMLHSIGADVVGMSTVIEAIAARWAGLRICGISVITNPAAGGTGAPLAEEEVLAAAVEAGPRVARVIRRFLVLLRESGEAADLPERSGLS